MERTNFEKYMSLHNEIMTRLEMGKITIEMAKDINDLAFDKYIVAEAAGTTLKNRFVFDKKEPQSKEIGLKAFHLLTKLDRIEVEVDKAKKNNPDNTAKLEEKYIADQKKIWRDLESLPEDEYDAGKRMYYARFRRNRVKGRR